MNLREEKLCLRCDVSKKRFENLLNDERIKDKFQQIGANEQVKKSSYELEEIVNELNKLIDEVGCKELGKNSFEEVMECAKLNSISYIIGTMADAIIFDGKTVQDVIVDQLTVKDFLQNILICKEETIAKISLTKSIKEGFCNPIYFAKFVNDFFKMIEES